MPGGYNYGGSSMPREEPWRFEAVPLTEPIRDFLIAAAAELGEEIEPTPARLETMRLEAEQRIGRPVEGLLFTETRIGVIFGHDAEMRLTHVSWMNRAYLRSIVESQRGQDELF